MSNDWYYQVWVQCNYDKVVNVIQTYKDKWRAQNDADMRNAAIRHDTPTDLPPDRFYYVRPITEEQLNEEQKVKFLRHKKRDKEYFLAHYKGEFRPYATIIVEQMKHSIETCEYGVNIRLNEEGGRFEGCCLDYDKVTSITSTIVYSGCDRVSLEVAFLKMGNDNAAFVEIFESEDELIKWLSNSDTAAEAIEDKLLEIYCDRYRILGAF